MKKRDIEDVIQISINEMEYYLNVYKFFIEKIQELSKSKGRGIGLVPFISVRDSDTIIDNRYVFSIPYSNINGEVFRMTTYMTDGTSMLHEMPKGLYDKLMSEKKEAK